MFFVIYYRFLMYVLKYIAPSMLALGAAVYIFYKEVDRDVSTRVIEYQVAKVGEYQAAVNGLGFDIYLKGRVECANVKKDQAIDERGIAIKRRENEILKENSLLLRQGVKPVEDKNIGDIENYITKNSDIIRSWKEIQTNKEIISGFDEFRDVYVKGQSLKFAIESETIKNSIYQIETIYTDLLLLENSTFKDPKICSGKYDDLKDTASKHLDIIEKFKVDLLRSY